MELSPSTRTWALPSSGLVSNENNEYENSDMSGSVGAFMSRREDVSVFESAGWEEKVSNEEKKFSI